MKYNYFFSTLLIAFLIQTSNAQVTWSNKIASIVYNNCSTCHHTGGIGPFNLMSYSDAVSNSLTMKSSTQSKSMPPWKPDPTYRHLKNERFLTDAQIADIASWVDNGSPRGDISSEPIAPTYSSTSQMAVIDKTLTLPTYTVQAPIDEYRCFVVHAGNTTLKYINAIEYKPGNGAIVHHMVVYKDPSNYSDSLDQLDIMPGFQGNGTTAVSPNADFVGAWAPGEAVFSMPIEFGILLEANSDYVVEIHYAPGSMGQADSSVLNIKYTDYPSVRQVYIDAMLNHFTSIIGGFGSFNIPANTQRTFYERYTMPSFYDASILAVFPHMHKIGTSFKIWNYIPSTGDSIPIINIPKWNFHWQGFYTFQKILKLGRGTKVEARATYDNTTGNPDNPSSPPVNVYAGEHTTDEMMIAFFAYTSYLPGDENIILDSSIIAGGVDISEENPIRLNIYPNPVAQFLYVNFETIHNGMLDFSILNAQGQLLFTNKEVVMAQRAIATKIDIGQFSKGIYFLQCKDEQGNKLQKSFVVN
ncbi:MAG: T9SS type A sorting domain-containing protein [Bacteroidota bacterium]